jgi:hypothetical protein
MGRHAGARAGIRWILGLDFRIGFQYRRERPRSCLLSISAAAAPDCNPFWYVPCVGEGELSGPGGSRLYLLIGNFCRVFKDFHEHGAGQLSGLGVLVRGMVGGQ